MAGQLIALTARSGAGKDFLASHLINVHGFVRVSFSDELKIIAKTLYPWMELDYAPEDKNKIINHQMNVCNMSAREIWITLDSLRQVDPLIFVNGVKEKLNKLLSTGVDIIVTDVRKESEFDLMFDIGATIIKINQRITDNDVLYDGEDIIDSFKVDLSFTNIKHQGLKRWEEFCIENEIIDSNWINILPTMAAAQMKENFIFGQNIQRDHSPFMWRAAIA